MERDTMSKQSTANFNLLQKEKTVVVNIAGMKRWSQSHISDAGILAPRNTYNKMCFLFPYMRCFLAGRPLEGWRIVSGSIPVPASNTRPQPLASFGAMVRVFSSCSVVLAIFHAINLFPRWGVDCFHSRFLSTPRHPFCEVA